MHRQIYNGRRAKERETEVALRDLDMDGETARGVLGAVSDCNELEAFLHASHAWEDDGEPWGHYSGDSDRTLLRASRIPSEVRERSGRTESVLLSWGEGVQEVNIFLTQQRSAWFQNMMDQARNNVGYIKESWTTRAMIAFGPAGMEGKMYTVNEIELALAPFIGLSQNRHSLNNLVRRAARRGIIERTGKKRYVEGTRNPYPEYKVCGHIEIDSSTSVIRCVGMRQSHQGYDAVAEGCVRREG